MLLPIAATILCAGLILFSVWLQRRSEPEHVKFRRWIDKVDPSDFRELEEVDN